MIALFALAGLTLLGCSGDLGAIKSFSSSSLDSDKGKTLIDDFVNGPTLRRKYEPEEEQLRLTEEAEKRRDQTVELTALLKSVQEYMSAVGQLAGDETVGYDRNLDSLATELNSKNLLKKDSATAVGGIGKTLAKAVKSAYRRNRLSDVIAEGNDPLQDILKDLQELLLKDFDSNYDELQASIGRYFRRTVAEAQISPHQEASILLVRELWAKRIADIEGKRAALKEYAKALEAVAKGHQMLFDNRENLSDEKVLQEIRGYGASVADLFSNVKALLERKWSWIN
jgi:hypothetical protein